MLKSSKDANKTMRSIEAIITDRKRGKEIEHPKTTFTFNSDKQKNFKENTENKNKKLLQARHRIQGKISKRKHPKEKHTAKTCSINITLDVNFNIISYGNSHCVEFLKQKTKSL